MNKSYSSKSYLLTLSLFLVMVLGFSCADVPSTGPEPPAVEAQFRFVHAAADLGNIGITVDGVSAGSLDYMQNTSYQTFNAGSREIILTTMDTLRAAMSTSKKGTIIILPKVGEFRSPLRLNERRLFDPAVTETGMLRIVHAAMAPTDLDVVIAGTAATDADTVELSLAFKDDSGYQNIAAGSYTVSVKEAGTDNVLVSSTFEVANKRQTSVISGADAANLSLINLQDD